MAARANGLDVVNLGYAGAARGEIASAEELAGLPADLISISYGTNCWTRTPHSAAAFREGLRAFLDVVRQGPERWIARPGPPEPHKVDVEIRSLASDLRRDLDPELRCLAPVGHAAAADYTTPPRRPGGEGGRRGYGVDLHHRWGDGHPVG